MREMLTDFQLYDSYKKGSYGFIKPCCVLYTLLEALFRINHLRWIDGVEEVTLCQELEGSCTRPRTLMVEAHLGAQQPSQLVEPSFKGTFGIDNSTAEPGNTNHKILLEAE